jgi:Mlc titration factor MtfA (ptsG expression regulator)
MFGKRRKADLGSAHEWVAREILTERVPLWRELDDDRQERLLQRTARFVRRRRWEGIGLEVDDVVQVVIGAHACLLGLEFDRDPFDDVTSIVVYPSTVVRRGSRHLGGGVAGSGPLAIEGETVRGGPVVLVWSAAEAGARYPDRGRNVVIHEFAHRLDMRDGVVDGMPPQPNRPAELAWQATLETVFAQLVAEVDPFLGRYAVTNHGELFAVASERFFTRPHELAAGYPGFYARLRAFYRQDPATRRPPRGGVGTSDP